MCRIICSFNDVCQICGAHTASYPMGDGASFPGSKAAGAWSWPRTSIQRPGQESVELYFHPPPNTPFTFTLTYRQCENGGSMVLRNVNTLPQHHTVSQPRRPRLESSPQLTPQISQVEFHFVQRWDKFMWALVYLSVYTSVCVTMKICWYDGDISHIVPIVYLLEGINRQTTSYWIPGIALQGIR